MRDSELLMESVAWATENEDVITLRFYEILFDRYPSVRPLFSRESATQAKMLQDAIVAAIEHMDSFWETKDYVYGRVINVPSNILAEARLCELVAREIGDGIFARFESFDDAALAKALGQRYEEIQLRGGEDEDYVLRPRGGRGEVLVRTRKRYFVDRRVGEGRALEASRWGERYQHEKVRSFLISRNRQLELPGVDLASPEFEAPEI